MKTIGIIGGMGPLATVDIFNKIVKNTKAEKDWDHIPVLIANVPQIPDRTESILNGGPSPVPEIVKWGRYLEDGGAELLLIPCNTSHYYYNSIQEQLQVPVLNMIDLTVERIKEKGYGKVGIIGTAGTLKTGIYQKKLEEEGVDFVVPEENHYAIMQYVIYDIVKAGDFTKNIDEFLELLEEMKKKGAEAIILGCTELPLLFERYEIETTVIDPTGILAEEAVNRAQE